MLTNLGKVFLFILLVFYTFIGILFMKDKSELDKYKTVLKSLWDSIPRSFIYLLVFLTIVLLVGYFNRWHNSSDPLNDFLLYVTALFVAWYTIETNILRVFSVRPIITFERYKDYPINLKLKNIGKGPALNIRLKITQIHSNGKFTNLKDLDPTGIFPINNMGENENPVGGDELPIMKDYIDADKDEFQWGQKNVFALIAIYEDLNKKEYISIGLCRVSQENDKRIYTIEKTKVSEYFGDTEAIKPSDWVK